MRKKQKSLRILWIPGLGADSSMFIPMIQQWNRLYNGNVYNHFIKFYEVPSNQFQTLEEYALYLYKKNQKNLKYKFDLIIGCSLGGMILQIWYQRRKIQSKYYILLSTAFSGDDLTLLAKFSILILKMVPVFLRKKIQNVVSFSYRWFRFNLKYSYPFSKMFFTFPTHVFFESPIWISNWTGNTELVLDESNLILIHGKKDPLISFRKISRLKTPDVIFPEGNHIIFALYPEEIVKKIITFIQPL